MENTKITASIVTYNSSREIKSVLNSLYRSSIAYKLAIYVVDNNSTDDTTKIIENEFADVQLIQLKKNIGFGAGHNEVISKVNSEYHLIINPDITFGESLIAELTNYMDKNPDVVSITPRILNFDGTEQFLPKRDPKIKYFIGGRFERFGGIFAKWRSEYTRRNEVFLEPAQIEFATGCFMFIRTSVLKKINGFDVRYFLHFEDADLSRELRKYGILIAHPDYEVTHLWKRDNVGSKKVFFIALVSMFKYFIKWGLR